jgi:hypothetical protein
MLAACACLAGCTTFHPLPLHDTRGPARITDVRVPPSSERPPKALPKQMLSNRDRKYPASLPDGRHEGLYAHVLGARVPIALTSRADAVRARVMSCALARLVAHHASTVLT